MPNRGLFHQLVGEMTVPTFGNSLEFYKLSYRGQWYHPLPRDFIFAIKGEVGYGDGFLGDKDLPFFENFYAGGPRSVRGYSQNSLGPRDNFGNPLGGNVKVGAGAEVIIPIPFLEQFDQFRFSGFVDAGNVYCTGNTINDVLVTTTTSSVSSIGSTLSVGGITTSVDSRRQCSDDNHFDLGKLRYSAGLSAVWISPMGVMSFSLSRPFNNETGDHTESFQFNIGTSF
jgi:outer membrane protein insertion porin family